MPGVRYVLHNPVLNSIMWTGAAHNPGSAMYDALLVIFGTRYLQLSPGRRSLQWPACSWPLSRHRGL
jgi:hypothetical protein